MKRELDELDDPAADLDPTTMLPRNDAIAH
jgi:hypothetical protein